jgi:uncharacterized repeat protein (TIGR01451 family)
MRNGNRGARRWVRGSLVAGLVLAGVLVMSSAGSARPGREVTAARFAPASATVSLVPFGASGDHVYQFSFSQTGLGLGAALVASPMGDSLVALTEAPPGVDTGVGSQGFIGLPSFPTSDVFNEVGAAGVVGPTNLQSKAIFFTLEFNHTNSEFEFLTFDDVGSPVGTQAFSVPAGDVFTRFFVDPTPGGGDELLALGENLGTQRATGARLFVSSTGAVTSPPGGFFFTDPAGTSFQSASNLNDQGQFAVVEASDSSSPPTTFLVNPTGPFGTHYPVGASLSGAANTLTIRLTGTSALILGKTSTTPPEHGFAASLDLFSGQRGYFVEYPAFLFLNSDITSGGSDLLVGGSNTSPINFAGEWIDEKTGNMLDSPIPLATNPSANTLALPGIYTTTYGNLGAYNLVTNGVPQPGLFNISVAPPCTPTLKIEKRLYDPPPSGLHHPPGYDGSVGFGATITFEITVTNTSTDCYANTVVVRDVLPNGIESVMRNPWHLSPFDVSFAHTSRGTTMTATLPHSLPPGDHAIVLVRGKVSLKDFDPADDLINDLVNTAQLLSPVIETSNTVKVLATVNVTSISLAATPTGASGVAAEGQVPKGVHHSNPSENKPAQTNVAVESVTTGKAAKAYCLWLNNTGRLVTKPLSVFGTCDTPIWLRAHGTTHWSIRFPHHLPKGRYQLLVRAVNRAGSYNSTFSRALHNLIVFTVH